MPARHHRSVCAAARGGTHQVGVHAIPLLGGVDTPAYEDLPEASLAQLAVHVVFRAPTNLHLQQQQRRDNMLILSWPCPCTAQHATQAYKSATGRPVPSVPRAAACTQNLGAGSTITADDICCPSTSQPSMLPHLLGQGCACVIIFFLCVLLLGVRSPLLLHFLCWGCCCYGSLPVRSPSALCALS